MVSEAARALQEAHVAVMDLGLRRPTLDDVFLELTGTRTAGDGDGGGGPGTAGAGAFGDGAVASRGRGRRRRERRLRRRAGSQAASATARRDGARPAALHPPAAAPALLDRPADHVRAAVRVRVRRRDRGSLPPGVAYIDFLLPGIFIQSQAFRSTQTAIGLAQDLERGVVDRFRSMPMARPAVLVGRTAADLVRGVFVAALMVAVGYLIGFRFRRACCPPRRRGRGRASASP